MTSTEVLAGDFIKKLLQNLPKETKEENIEISRNENIKSQFNDNSNNCAILEITSSDKSTSKL